MPEHELLAISGEAVESLSAADEAAIQAKLTALLKRRTELYTLGDSSSVRIETAQELLKSIIFCLELYLGRGGESLNRLALEEPEELFARAQRLCEEELARGRALYSRACLTAPGIDNISYRDTLIGIGTFFKRYDYRFFAHQIPCDIDYQLCRAVPENMEGIAYINEYLRRLLIENGFIGRFEKSRVESLLEQTYPDYRGLLINLFEPVCTNAVGLALIGGDIMALKITPAELEALSAFFEPLSATPAKETLRDAADRVCVALGLKPSRYVSRTAEELFPRIEAVLPYRGLGGVFTPF